MKKVIGGFAVALALASAAPALAQQGITFSSGQQAGEVLTYRLRGTRVFNAKGEIIGEFKDVALDANGQAKIAVIGLGGVLGFGAKEVGVPFSALKVGPVVESSRVLLLDVTKEQLEKAPVYKGTDPTRIDRGQKKLADWTKVAKEKAIELGKQAGTAIQGVREKMSTPAPATAPAAPAAPPAAAPAPAAPAAPAPK